MMLQSACAKRSDPRRWGAAPVTLLAMLAAALLAPAAAGQDDADGMEPFEEVDPYTQGEAAAVGRLGYRSLGPFPFMGPHRTDTVALELGGVPVLFVETEHFRIATTLTSYAYRSDRDEKEKLEEELERFEERLGDFDQVKRKTLDPWLRLHLFAQRAEEAFDAFVEWFDIEPDDYSIWGPHLGQREKYVVVLCQRQSEYGRFLRRFLGVDAPMSYRWYVDGGGMGLAIDVEGVAEVMRADRETPLDTVVHCSFVHALAGNFVSAYRRNNGGAPYWLEAALAHLMVRRVDPRFVLSYGLRDGETIDEDDHEWEDRVQNLVRNDFFVGLEDMFAWQEYADLNKRDHMVAWSKLEYLLTAVEGDHSAFLNAICAVAPGGDDETRIAREVERQLAALEDHLGLTPAAFDEGWAKWVRKAYRRR